MRAMQRSCPVCWGQIPADGGRDKAASKIREARFQVDLCDQVVSTVLDNKIDKTQRNVAKILAVCVNMFQLKSAFEERAGRMPRLA